jgi:hypothetical protein
VRRRARTTWFVGVSILIVLAGGFTGTELIGKHDCLSAYNADPLGAPGGPAFCTTTYSHSIHNGYVVTCLLIAVLIITTAAVIGVRRRSTNALRCRQAVNRIE